MNVSGSSRLLGSGHALAAAAVLGLISAVADWVWYRFLEDGALLPALVHGLIFFLVIALVLPASGGKRWPAVRRLLATLPLVGVALAAVFYPLAALTGYLAALLVTWAGMWIALAMLHAWASRQPRALRNSIVRGLLGAACSGAAFATVSWMWTAPSPGGPSVPLHFLCWTWALLPGFAALLVGQREPTAPG